MSGRRVGPHPHTGVETFGAAHDPEEDWILCAMNDRSGRRGIWMRRHRREPANRDGSPLMRLEICSGREGEDWIELKDGQTLTPMDLEGVEGALATGAWMVDLARANCDGATEERDELKAENAQLRAVVEALPRCVVCGRTGTRHCYRDDGPTCDEQALRSDPMFDDLYERWTDMSIEARSRWAAAESALLEADNAKLRAVVEATRAAVDRWNNGGGATDPRAYLIQIDDALRALEKP